MEELFMIIVTSCDTLEKSYGDAIVKYELGSVSGKEKADKIVEELNSKFGRKYEGWGGEMFPFYSSKPIFHFDKKNLDKNGYLKRK